MKTRKQLMIGADCAPGSESREQPIEKTLCNSVSGDVIGCSSDCFECPHSSRHNGFLYMSHCVDFHEVYIKLSSSVCRALEKGQFLFLVIPNQKDGRKLEPLVWRIVDRYWRKIII